MGSIYLTLNAFLIRRNLSRCGFLRLGIAIVLTAPSTTLAAFVASFQHADTSVNEGEVWNPSPYPEWKLEQTSNNPKFWRIRTFSITFAGATPSSVQVPQMIVGPPASSGGLVSIQVNIEQPVKFNDEGAYPIRMSIPYDYNEFVDGEWVSKSGQTSQVTLGVEVLNVAPSITQIQNDLEVEIGQAFQYFASATDPGLDQLTYGWDLDGDQQYDDSSNPQGEHSFHQLGDHVIGVRVLDGDGGQAEASFVVRTMLSGDFNQDGTVDAADYVMWRENNGDDVAAYNIWRANFGRQAGSVGASISTTPEPASIFLLGLGIIFLNRRDAR